MREAADQLIGAELAELTQATGGAFQFVFSGGGEPLASLFRQGSMEIPGFDPTAPSGMGETGGSLLLFHGHSPIGAELPALSLAVHSSLQHSGLWFVRVPSLMAFPGPAVYAFPESVVNRFFASRGPLRLYLPGSSDIAVEFALESARAFVEFAHAYLDVVGLGEDYRTSEAWITAFG
jgi:hypothetical protein